VALRRRWRITPPVDRLHDVGKKERGFKGLERPLCSEKHLTMKEDKCVQLSSSIEASPEELAASISAGDREIHHPNGE